MADEEELEDGGEDEEETVLFTWLRGSVLDMLVGGNVQANNGHSQTGSLHLASRMQTGHLNGPTLTVAHDIGARVTPSNRSIDMSVARAGTIPVGRSQVDECAGKENV